MNQLVLFNYSEHQDNAYFDNEKWEFTKKIYWNYNYKDDYHFRQDNLHRFGSRKLFNNFKQIQGE
jgi:hypothetical protein